jgi:hypothetical protein
MTTGIMKSLGFNSCFHFRHKPKYSRSSCKLHHKLSQSSIILNIQMEKYKNVGFMIVWLQPGIPTEHFAPPLYSEVAYNAFNVIHKMKVSGDFLMTFQ